MDNLENISFNYIKDTLAKIDKIQKDVIINPMGTCVTCETSLFSQANNTIPVALYSRNGDQIMSSSTLEGITQFYRVESIRCNRYVTLRLLQRNETEGLEATNYTMILDMDILGGIQCFEPITIVLCNTTTN